MSDSFLGEAVEKHNNGFAHLQKPKAVYYRTSPLALPALCSLYLQRRPSPRWCYDLTAASSPFSSTHTSHVHMPPLSALMAASGERGVSVTVFMPMLFWSSGTSSLHSQERLSVVPLSVPFRSKRTEREKSSSVEQFSFFFFVSIDFEISI